MTNFLLSLLIGVPCKLRTLDFVGDLVCFRDQVALTSGVTIRSGSATWFRVLQAPESVPVDVRNQALCFFPWRHLWCEMLINFPDIELVSSNRLCIHNFEFSGVKKWNWNVKLIHRFDNMPVRYFFIFSFSEDVSIFEIIKAQNLVLILIFC